MNEYSDLISKKEFFKTTHNITSKEELDQWINIELPKIEGNRTLHVAFRGVNEAKYKMYNSFQRLWSERNLNALSPSAQDRILDMINHCKNSVLARYLKRLGVICNDWYILSFLQHYGAASPFLDFSRQFKVALFFACDNVNYYESNNEIDNYISVYYYKNVDVINAFSNSVYAMAREIAADLTPNKNLASNFWKEYMSFEKVSEIHDWYIVPSYSNSTNISNKRGQKVTTYTISNLNSTNQDGEFVCNLDMSVPLEEKIIKGGVKYICCLNIHKGLVPYIVKNHLGGSIDIARKKYYKQEVDIANDAVQHALEM